MTNSAEPVTSGPTTSSAESPGHRFWRTVDIVCTTLLTAALVPANAFVAFICFLAVALSDTCGSGPCDSGDSATGAAVFGGVFLTLSLIVTVVGLRAVVRKSVRMPLVCAPLAGFALTAFALLGLFTSGV